MRESFGPLVADWLAEGARAADGGANRRARLEGRCGLLGLDPAAVGGLRYNSSTAPPPPSSKPAATGRDGR